MDAIAQAIDRLTATQGKGALDWLGFSILVLTFAALVWYTVETYRLRIKTTEILGEARRQNEMTILPMLALYVDRSGHDLRLLLRNLGTGPAFNVSVEPLTWDNRTWTILDAPEVMAVSETETLRCHLEVVVGSHHQHESKINAICYHLIAKEFDEPPIVRVRCRSLSAPYTFRFLLANDQGNCIHHMNPSSRAERESRREPAYAWL